MRKILLLIIVISLQFGCNSHRKTTASFAQTEFYKTHVGAWKGILNIFQEDSIVRRLPMQFNILPTDTSNRYKWQIKYDTQPQRDYRLDILDTKKGSFQIDEMNGIILPANLNNGIVSSYFSVAKSTLLISYDFRSSKKIIFSVNAFGTEPIRYTGQGNSQIDSIGVYPFFGYQEAVLERIK